MVKAIFFDVFGTVVDWRSGIANAFDQAFAKSGSDIKPLDLADAWRAEIASRLAENSGDTADGAEYTGLDAIHCDALEKVLADADLTHRVGSKEKAALEKSWEHLRPWPDSVPGLRSLRREYVIAPCNPASISMMTWLAKSAGLPWDLILGADIARRYPPAGSVYTRSAAAVGLAPGETMLVSAHNRDLDPARAAGLKTAFFSRPKEFGKAQTSDLAPADAWDVIAFDLLDLARQMEASLI
ncbi:HAD family hydrolase [Stappia sp. ES.058]|uniref:HAD family hydrolase n=1 Tax=Stappia sp. ES.058 TaxID=1881061 RepID=UPI000879ABEB|nr:HAD family hydrolase [Stappia sp. ES.058]SDT89840.1 2-haloacid dehalogenase [Stappia sp. ES.058]